jgi:hypothetical protein
MWLHTEELPKQHIGGFDRHEGFTEVGEDGDVKIPLGFKFKYSIPWYLRRPLKKSLVGSASPRSM